MAITKLNSLAIPPNTIVESDLSYPLTNFSSTGIDDNATSTAITIDSSGNLGLSATPDAHYTGYSVFNIGASAVVLSNETTSDTNVTMTINNAYLNTGASAWVYKNSDEATRYTQISGQHRWDTAASGTAGGTITWNEAMRIDGSGDVFIKGGGQLKIERSGASNFSAFYTDTGDSTIINNSWSNQKIVLTRDGNVIVGGTSAQASDAVTLMSDGEVTAAGFYFSNNIGSAMNDTGIRRATTSTMVFDTASTERMRIDSTGDVLIGTNATSYLNAANRQVCHVNGGTDGAILALTGTASGSYPGSTGDFYIASGASGTTNTSLVTRSNGYMNFYTNNTERMRIDSSGNVLVGTTALVGSGQSGIHLRDASGIVGSMGIAKTATGTWTAVAFYHNSTSVGRIDYTDTATSYVTSSDQRLKENIVDAPAGNIDAIRVRSFDWKADGTHQTYGMVAQELVDVAPEAVSQGETEEDMWGVDYSKLVPMMIKEIQDLKAEVAALKGA